MVHLALTNVRQVTTFITTVPTTVAVPTTVPTTILVPTTLTDTLTTTELIPTTLTETTTFVTSYPVTVTDSTTIYTTETTVVVSTTVSTYTTVSTFTSVREVTNTVTNTVPVTVTLPGETVITSVTLCPVPTNTAPVIRTKTSKRQVWGCDPGFVCKMPKPGNCNVWTDSPSRDFVCEPQYCAPAPYYPHVEWPKGETGYYPLTEGYFNLNPNAFGLSYDIFEQKEVVTKIHGKKTTITTGNWVSQTSLTHFPPEPSVTARSYRLRALSKRDETIAPGVCFAFCQNAYNEAQKIGLTDDLCILGTSFRDSYDSCRLCIDENAEDIKVTWRAYLGDKFLEYVDFCDIQPPEEQTSTDTPPQTQVTDTSVPPVETTTQDPINTNTEPVPITSTSTTPEPTSTPEPTPTSTPSSAEPSTEEPSTAEPSTEEPTTAEPTSAEPTSDEPTSAEPTTTGPSSSEPSAEPSESETSTPSDTDASTNPTSTDSSPSSEPSPTEPPVTPGSSTLVTLTREPTPTSSIALGAAGRLVPRSFGSLGNLLASLLAVVFFL